MSASDTTACKSSSANLTAQAASVYFQLKTRMAQLLREWSMNSIDDWAYWTRNMKRIIITLIICGLLPAFIICGLCEQQLDATYIGPSNQHLNQHDQGWGYYCPPCNRYLSLRKDSVFENSNVSLKSWITAIFHFSRDSNHLANTIHKDCKRDNGWTERRVYPIIMMLRKCVARFYNDNLPILGENGKEVQIDESVHSKKHKYNVGDYTRPRWVFGMYEPETGWRKFLHVPDRRRNTLLPIIQFYIQRGARVISDCWMAYATLNDEGYDHLEVNHSYEFANQLTGVHTDCIEGVWKWTKRYCLDKGGCQDFYLQLMLDCFSFRAMFVNNNKDHAFRIICNAIRETHHHFRISDTN